VKKGTVSASSFQHQVGKVMHLDSETLKEKQKSPRAIFAEKNNMWRMAETDAASSKDRRQMPLLPQTNY
jgi:hypothetical protein